MDTIVTVLLNLWYSPRWLWGLFLVPCCVAVFLLAQHRRRRVLARLGNLRLIGELAGGLGAGRTWLRTVLLAGSLAFGVLAAARPQWGTISQLVRSEGVDVILLLDTSLSMLAPDVPPNRLAAAKHEISAFLDRLASDRVALVPFAGTAFVQCPLTLDYSAVKLFLNDINTNTIPVEGTALGTAIRIGLNGFVRHTECDRVMILITDGEDHESNPLEAAQEAGERSVRIYTVGIGSSDGELIPQESGAGGTQYLRDREGRVVKTRLDEVMLQRIAVATGGKYYRSTVGELELEQIFDDISDLERGKHAEAQLITRVDRYQWPLAACVALALIIPFIPERRRRKNG